MQKMIRESRKNFFYLFFYLIIYLYFCGLYIFFSFGEKISLVTMYVQYIFLRQNIYTYI